jgi:TP53 regulating kinase and related kinases
MDTSNLATQPFHRGAEAELLLSKIDSWNAVVKRRTRKGYRHESLDKEIRRERTYAEASILHEAKVAGVRVPSIIGIEPETNTFVMTQIEGTVVRDCLDSMSRRNAVRLFKSLGKEVGLLHAAGIVHGDLTTSNVVVSSTGLPYLVDFGLSRRSVEPEDRGVDLHLLQRSIGASHVQDSSPLIKALISGYRESAGEKVLGSSLAKAREIARRGRYFAIR